MATTRNTNLELWRVNSTASLLLNYPLDKVDDKDDMELNSSLDKLEVLIKNLGNVFHALRDLRAQTNYVFAANQGTVTDGDFGDLKAKHDRSLAVTIPYTKEMREYVNGLGAVFDGQKKGPSVDQVRRLTQMVGKDHKIVIDALPDHVDLHSVNLLQGIRYVADIRKLLDALWAKLQAKCGSWKA
ncbi:hypothetical protein LTR05_002509 [Lithohypha guttulata]|uniref:Uncharacterized protein n=1 Tax=Lithohypha guttulata TaxID=1690604 RepID=A0AAN7T402_9EURO|nr:hypothetical protein LTR05_002509 [Lithohypha guttulata]